MNWRKQLSPSLRNLTLERLTGQIDSYNAGYLSQFALTADAMEQRDDLLRTVVSKRKKAVARHGWAILTSDDSPEAQEQRTALDYFYNNIKCTHVLKQDLTGGFNLLVHQMLDAVGKGWAVHEITWKSKTLPNSKYQLPIGKLAPEGAEVSFANCITNSTKTAQDDSTVSYLPAREAAEQNSAIGNRKSEMLLAAELRFVPLWFFENTTGRLRFLQSDSSSTGVEMKPKEWLVTTGEGLMVACARAYLFKHSPLQAWLDYCLQYGTPGLRAVTTATRGSADWDAMVETLKSFVEDLAVVTNNSENIEVIDLKGDGRPPFAELVDRMDRTMAALWRGADLSTISRDQGYGASLQEQESRLIEVDDAEMISDTLNNTLDRWVIEYLFGKTAPQLAYVKILVSPKECTPQDLAIDQFLVKHGAKLSIAKTLERYGRAAAAEGEEALADISNFRLPTADLDK